MNKILFKIFLSISVCILLYLFIKNDGLIDYYQKYDYYQKLVNDKNILSQELKNIQTENELLKNNKRYIEKIAREEYFYIYPDEIIISLD